MLGQLPLWDDGAPDDGGAVPVFLGRCEHGHASRAHAAIWRCHCGAQVAGAPIEGHTSKRRCDARCEYAVGPSCSCTCGGRNHGAGLALIGG